MKRSAYLILASLLVSSVALTACGDDDDDPIVVADATDSTEADTTEQDTTEADTTEPDATVVEPGENECISDVNNTALAAYGATDDCQELSSLASAAGTGDLPGYEDCNATLCAVSCTDEQVAEKAACIQGAVEDISGVDTLCSTCVADLAVCVITECGLSCAGGTDAPACVTCMEEAGCQTTYGVCAGFGADYETCVTPDPT